MISNSALSQIAKEGKFEFPIGYLRVFELGLTNLEPWYFLDDKEYQLIEKGINTRYLERYVIPFARRKDCDDVACFLVKPQSHNQENVLLIHNYASPGNEIDKVCTNFWNWFKLAVDEMIEWTKMTIDSK